MMDTKKERLVWVITERRFLLRLLPDYRMKRLNVPVKISL